MLRPVLAPRGTVELGNSVDHLSVHVNLKRAERPTVPNRKNEPVVATHFFSCCSVPSVGSGKLNECTVTATERLTTSSVSPSPSPSQI